jgi:hypothetical protein
MTRHDIRRMAPYRRERHQNTAHMPPVGKLGQKEFLDTSYSTTARDILVTLRVHGELALDSQGIADAPLVEQLFFVRRTEERSSKPVSIWNLIGP